MRLAEGNAPSAKNQRRGEHHRGSHAKKSRQAPLANVIQLYAYVQHRSTRLSLVTGVFDRAWVLAGTAAAYAVVRVLHGAEGGGPLEQC